MTMHQRRGRHGRAYRFVWQLRSIGRHTVWARRAARLEPVAYVPPF
jgi:hypothetical protein